MTISDPEESAQIIAKAIAPLVIEDNVKETEEDAYNWLLTDDTEVKDYLYSLFLTDTVTGFCASYHEAFNNEGAKDLSNKFTKYISNFLWNDNPNGEDLVEWNSWTSSSDGPTQLLLDADLNKAIITMSHERTSYESILNEIENDHSITDEDKNTIVKEVLNGRWFSSRLDSYFNN